MVNSIEIPIPTTEDRFYIELEFIQNLSNPSYLHYLACNGYFDEEEFINYLKYLCYWKEPDYLIHLIFPQCLVFLDALINNIQFRKELRLSNFIEFIHQQQGEQWMNKERKL